MSKIIEQIPEMREEQLLNLFKNACRLLAIGPNKQAESVISAVEREWSRRLELARGCGSLFTPRPEKGMLATLGYHVGENGEKTPVRRRILAGVVEGALPLVDSPAYTAEWGSPNSHERYWKLTRFLEGQITNSAFANMEKAVIEWSEDLDWIRQKYSHLACRHTVLEPEPA
jgi:hypothetical protein